MCIRLLLANLSFIQDVQIMSPLTLLNRLVACLSLVFLAIFQITDIQTFFLVVFRSISNFPLLISLHLGDYMLDVLIIQLIIAAVKSSERIFSLVQYRIAIFINKSLELRIKVKLTMAPLMALASLCSFFFFRYPYLSFWRNAFKLLLILNDRWVSLIRGHFFLIRCKVKIEHRFRLLFTCCCREDLLKLRCLEAW